MTDIESLSARVHAAMQAAGTDQPWTLRARWVVPVVRPPIAGGCVVIRANRIFDVGTTPEGPVVDAGDVALIPGLVNAHTHLEFSDLAEPIAPTGTFTDWLRAVIALRRQASDRPGAIRQGLLESARAGTALLGEIDTGGWDEAAGAWSHHKLITPRVVRFRELIGLSDERIEQMTGVIDATLTHQPSELPVLAAGLSPHATYTVHPRLLELAIERARAAGRLVAMHIAETAAERELVEAGTGPFRDFLDSLGLWQPSAYGGRTMHGLLEQLARAPRGLIIHGNFLSDDELQFLAQQLHLTMVVCPRTHAAFGHPAHPWPRLLQLGGRVALGTDGRSSNPDLSLFKELQFLAATTREVSPAQILRLGTTAGAHALGDPDRYGRLASDSVASIAALNIPELPNSTSITEDELCARLLGDTSRVAWSLHEGTTILPGE